MRRSQGVTLSDIARETGVSKVTVSCILNDRSTGTVRASEGTRQRVLAAARSMGYHPNGLARALARNRTDTLTLVMQSPSVFSGGSGFVGELMHGVVDAANSAGLDLMLHTKSLPDPDAEVRFLTDGRSDGALLLRDRDDPVAARLDERGHPCVSIFSRPADVPGSWSVDCDNVAGARAAVEHLLGLGHRRIGFIAGSPRSAAAAGRQEGWAAALADAGIAPDPRLVVPIYYAGGDFGELTRLMCGLPAAERPTALFAWSDDVAVRAVHVLHDACGLRVPDDVSVVGFDGTEAVCERGSVPRLTSVRQPIYDIAARGVALLVARIRGEEGVEPRVLFPPTLVVRASTARAREL